jgi:hypothetical protein
MKQSEKRFFFVGKWANQSLIAATRCRKINLTPVFPKVSSNTILCVFGLKSQQF